MKIKHPVKFKTREELTGQSWTELLLFGKRKEEREEEREEDKMFAERAERDKDIYLEENLI